MPIMVVGNVDEVPEFVERASRYRRELGSGRSVAPKPDRRRTQDLPPLRRDLHHAPRGVTEVVVQRPVVKGRAEMDGLLLAVVDRSGTEDVLGRPEDVGWHSFPQLSPRQPGKPPLERRSVEGRDLLV